ncbi:MAG: restriction endonuclease subunit S [Muribaculaceae bacterium]|nr:restriction endonuclease subunit S [Muribaculaceae bacterium]
MADKVYKIKDLGKIITGKTPSTSKPEFYGGSIPFLTPTDDLNGIYVPETTKKLTSLGASAVKNCVLPPNSICVSCIGSDLGKVVITKEETVTNQQFNSIIPFNEVNPYYLYYTFISLERYLKELSASSTSVPIINKSDFSEIRIGIPSISKQKKISSILYSLDRKIALNREINRNLEAMARQLYDYWFVQFDFPDENGKSYKSSGGIMQYNDVLKTNIPQDWTVVSVNNITESQRGVSFDKSDVSTEGIQVLRGNNIENDHFVEDSNIVIIPNSLVSEEQHIKQFDIIMTMSSGSKEHVGKCMQFQRDSDHTYGAFLNRFRPIKYPHYLFLFLTSPLFKAKIKSLCNGTGINNLTFQTFNDIMLPIAPSDIMSQFSSIVYPLFAEIGINEAEIEKLTKQRDELLPLLMNGQVSVMPTAVNCDLSHD